MNRYAKKTEREREKAVRYFCQIGRLPFPILFARSRVQFKDVSKLKGFVAFSKDFIPQRVHSNRQQPVIVIHRSTSLRHFSSFLRTFMRRVHRIYRQNPYVFVLVYVLSRDVCLLGWVYDLCEPFTEGLYRMDVDQTTTTTLSEECITPVLLLLTALLSLSPNPIIQIQFFQFLSSSPESRLIFIPLEMKVGRIRNASL
jgi:hypothetical protein